MICSSSCVAAWLWSARGSVGEMRRWGGGPWLPEQWLLGGWNKLVLFEIPKPRRNILNYCSVISMCVQNTACCLKILKWFLLSVHQNILCVGWVSWLWSVLLSTAVGCSPPGKSYTSCRICCFVDCLRRDRFLSNCRYFKTHKYLIYSLNTL